MATWPATLPHLNAGATEQRQQGFIRTPMSMGPGKQRRRFSAVSRLFKGQMHLTAAQRATFDTFYQGTLSEGSLEFDFTDPIDFSTATYRFTAAPQFQLLTGTESGVTNYIMTVELELLP